MISPSGSTMAGLSPMKYGRSIVERPAARS
jgi:hypothetical protein